MESFKKHKNTITFSNEERKNHFPVKSLNFNDIEIKNVYNSENLKTNTLAKIKSHEGLVNFSDYKIYEEEEDKIEDIKKNDKLSERIIKVNDIYKNSFKNNSDNKELEELKNKDISNIQINLDNLDKNLSINKKDNNKEYLNDNNNLSLRSYENFRLVKPNFESSRELGINNNFYYTYEPKKDKFFTKINNLNDSLSNNSKYKSPVKNKEISCCGDYRSQINLSKESKKSLKKRKSEKLKSQNNNNKEIEYIELSKKSEEEVKYTNEKFKTSRKRLFELLRDKKKFLIGAGISAGLNGAVWPMYGVLLAQAIGTLSQKDIELVHSGGIKIALYFFTLAVCASLVLWMQK
jgi:hypothetical protein